ncbi:transport and Golgi organization protein 1 isoform X1 [Helicoverpa armigera]|uniref:transport and Golgi organization protein 1 isoform X1 n=1 Tax=Helicoverpa armigera TaxID=29058 RepID=UPI0030829C21
MIVLKLILFTLFISVSQCRTPDKVYCVNKECNEPISKARTLLGYNSADPDLISFRGNSEAIVYMKSAGTNEDLWFVDINGIAGLVPTKFLRETKIIGKNLQVVAFESVIKDEVKPAKVQQAHEVFEGTTIYTTEASVSAEQQDSATDSPKTVSNEDLTPSLNSAIETPNENVDDNVPNDSNEANVSIENESNSIENSEPPNDESTTTASPEIAEQTEASNISNDLNEKVESTPETVTESVQEHTSSEQFELQTENSKEIPPETVPSPNLLATGSQGSLNSESIIEVPEKQNFLQDTLTEPDQNDSKEQNTSLNNNLENVQVPLDSSAETNVMPNGNSLNDNVALPSEEPVESQTKEPESLTTESPTSASTEPIINPNSEPVVPAVNEPVVLDVNEPVVPPAYEPIAPPANDPVVPPIYEPLAPIQQQVLPPIFSNINVDIHNKPQVQSEESNENTASTVADTIEMIPASMETLTTLDPVPEPSTESPLPVDPEIKLPTTTETIPATFSEVPSTVPTPDTIPPLVSVEAPPTTEIPTPDVPQQDLFATTPAPYNSEESSQSSEVPEFITTEANAYESVEDIISSLPDPVEDINSASTEAPVQDDNTEGFFSNMYSTVANIWPSSTESPEPLYNTEYPTYETEKADGDEGFSFMKYFMSMYYSVMGVSEESKALFPSVGETCFSDEYCDGTSHDGSNRLLTFLLTTASSVLLFTLGYYYIDNRRQDGRLIGTINSLQRDLLFTTKECEILKEELATTKSKLAGIEDSSFGMDDMVQSLKEEINELKATNDRLRNSLDDNEKLLRVSENTAGELQNTLSEVENTLSELLAERANFEEQIVELNGKIQAFEEELISVSRERDNFQLKYVSAESTLEEFKKQKKQFEEINQQLSESKNTIELQKHEVEALKDAIKELKNGTSADVDVTSFLDHTEIKAKLSKALQEKTSFESKYETELKERTRLSEELKASQETLATMSQSASEALTRLEVLGKYFQEREGELLKELSAKESLWLSKQGESASTVEKIELLQQEVQRYKEKCDALTLELAEQESSRRSALSEVEARAHAAWLEARAAKRDADAARDDAAALRRKLAALTAADGAVSPHHKVSSPLDTVENAVLPPPLPPMFLPPPLLPPLPRPPPLGRLPSPHPPRYSDRRYSPDSRYSPESRYSPDSRYSPETVRYSPDSRYSPRSRRSPYSPRSRRRSRSRERYDDSRATRSRNGPAPPLDTETEYNSDSPTRQPRRRGRYSRHSGPSSGSGCSSESDK